MEFYKLSKGHLFLIIILTVIILWGLNQMNGVSVSLMWLYYPELDHQNIFKDLEAHSKQNRHAINIKKKLPDNENSVTYASALPQCDLASVNERFDCHPEWFASREKCESRGCCWKSVGDNQSTKAPNQEDVNGGGNIPLCFYPKHFPAYKVKKIAKTSLGMQADLLKTSQAYYPKDVKHLRVEIMYETDTRLHVKIFDPSNLRYEVPLTVPRPSQRASNPQYTVSFGDIGQTFQLKVTRASTGKSLFQMASAAPLIFTDQFLQLSTLLPSRYISGLGEHRQGLLVNLNWTTVTFWNADQPPKESKNLYGSHPFYVMMEERGLASGFFMLNSNAMEAFLQPTPAITWRTIGGILDFYIFIGQNPSDVISEYTAVIGRPFMPPYWSLGFHICRFGYKNVSDTMKVVDRVRKAAIPQDTQWNDIDYAVGKRDFTTDTSRFGDQAGMVAKLHSRGMKYMVIVDPGISNSQPAGTYRPYDLGVKMDIFIKNSSGQLFVGKVWPGSTVFPDFSHPRSLDYWTTMIQEFHQMIPVDGLWIDMNEIANFIDGSEQGCAASEFDNPPYTPTGVVGGKLYHRTICNSAVQHLSRAYDLHNLYGLIETNATYIALRKVLNGRRPFIISRSTFSGQGHYGGHWTGDNFATFHDLYRSMSATITMNLLGIPMVGADICGFHGNTNYELCLRWYQLGAFYPFSRSHNSDDVKVDQDPGAFDARFASAVRSVYELRYSLLPLLYTLFYKSHVLGVPVATSMMYNFPQDISTYGIDSHFLWGSQLLIAPVLNKDATTVDVYLPSGTVWYNISSGQQYPGTGASVTLDAPLDIVNVLCQGGSIIPLQQPALTTSLSRKNAFSLLVAMGTDLTANGSLYWDDGDSDEFESGVYNYIKFAVHKSWLYSVIKRSSFKTDMKLGSIKFYGFPYAIKKMYVNGVSQGYLYSSKMKVLNVPKLKPTVDLLKPLLITW